MGRWFDLVFVILIFVDLVFVKVVEKGEFLVIYFDVFIVMLC